jgi:hypothetical protein
MQAVVPQWFFKQKLDDGQIDIAAGLLFRSCGLRVAAQNFLPPKFAVLSPQYSPW